MMNTNKTRKATAVKVDFPKVNETISAGHYAVRISAEHGVIVEVSVDGGPYSACHNAAGHWWYHLHGLCEGPHKVMARAIDPKGNTDSALRRFRVKK